MDETKAIAEKMKCMDLAEELGQVLGMSPVWKDDCVIYGGDLGDPYIMLMHLDNGRWGIATNIGGALYLPAEAPDLMAGMSEAIEGTEDDLGGKNNDKVD